MSIALTEEDIVENEVEQDQYLVFSVKGQEFAFQTIRVQEITSWLETSDVPNAPAYIEGIASLRGRLATVLDFRKRFGFPVKERDEDTRVIVVEQEDFPIGIIVDSVDEVLQINGETIQQLPESTSTSVAQEMIKGVGMMQGRLVILLDIDKVLAGTDAAQYAQAYDSVKAVVSTDSAVTENKAAEIEATVETTEPEVSEQATEPEATDQAAETVATEKNTKKK